MSQTTTLPVTGKLTIKQYNANGVLVDERNVNNLVVTDGRNWIRDRVLGTGTLGGATGIMNYMAIGYGTTAAAAGDIYLSKEAGRVGATGSSAGTGAVQYQATFPAGVGSTGITEAGIFAGATGTVPMLARTVFSVINKGSLDTLAITWTITIGS